MPAKTSGRRPSLLLIIFFLVLLALILWNYRSNIFWFRDDTVIVRQGLVKHERIIDVIFANTETVLTAPAEGKLILPQEEGRRFAKGETIARIIPTGVNFGDSEGEVEITAPNSGLFFSTYDNLENIVTPENLMNMDLEALLARIQELSETAEEEVLNDQDDSENDQNQSIDERDVSAAQEEEPETGQDQSVGKHTPVGKIVNNLYPTWMFVYLKDGDSMRKDDTVKIIVNDYEYIGRVMKEVDRPQGAIVRFGQYISGSSEERIKKVTWVVKPPTRGMIIPSESLVIQGEEKGVYVTEEGLSRFRPVKVVDDNGEVACVEGLREGDKIIKRQDI